MDVAWKLGVGSQMGDWELRMSMRSFWMHLRADSNYWIIGHIPAWIDRKQIRCLPWPDPYKHCKDANLLHKALRLAMEPRISDPFIFCSDDQILLRPIAPEDFRLWHGGEILKDPVDGINSWQRRLINTGLKLRNAGYPAMNFEGHIPYPLRKDWIKEALRFDFAAKPGMCVHSTIINCSGEIGIPLNSGFVRGWLGKAEMTEREIDKGLAENQFASINGDSIKNSYLISRVEQLFPEPAPWELDAKIWPQLGQADDYLSTI